MPLCYPPTAANSTGGDEPVGEVRKDVEVEVACGHESKLELLEFGVGEPAHPVGFRGQDGRFSIFHVNNHLP